MSVKITICIISTIRKVKMYIVAKSKATNHLSTSRAPLEHFDGAKTILERTLHFKPF